VAYRIWQFLIPWKQHSSPEHKEENARVKEKARRRRTAAPVRNREYPAERFLCHPKGLRVGHEEEDEGRIKCVFRFEGNIDWGRRRRLFISVAHFFS